MASSPWNPTFRAKQLSAPDLATGAKMITDALATPANIAKDLREEERTKQLLQLRLNQEDRAQSAEDRAAEEYATGKKLAEAERQAKILGTGFTTPQTTTKQVVDKNVLSDKMQKYIGYTNQYNKDLALYKKLKDKINKAKDITKYPAKQIKEKIKSLEEKYGAENDMLKYRYWDDYVTEDENQNIFSTKEVIKQPTITDVLAAKKKAKKAIVDNNEYDKYTKDALLTKLDTEVKTITDSIRAKNKEDYESKKRLLIHAQKAAIDNKYKAALEEQKGRINKIIAAINATKGDKAYTANDVASIFKSIGIEKPTGAALNKAILSLNKTGYLPANLYND